MGYLLFVRRHRKSVPQLAFVNLPCEKSENKYAQDIRVSVQKVIGRGAPTDFLAIRTHDTTKYGSDHFAVNMSVQAYDICTKRGLTRERVFLLGRMGNVKEALGLIINELQDMEEVKFSPLPVLKCVRFIMCHFHPPPNPKVLLVKLTYVVQAVKFIGAQHDEDLWEELINQSLKHPDMVSNG